MTVPVVEAEPDPYGPEMLANTSFTGGTSWYAEDAWTLANNRAEFDNSGGYSWLYQFYDYNLYQIEVSTTYHLTFTIDAQMTLRFDNQTTAVTYVAEAVYAAGTHEVNFTTPGTLGALGISVRGSGGTGAGNMTYMSLKEVL